MLEIYNDKVRDLGNPLDRDKPGGHKSASAELKIRNHPDTGAYVAGLSLNPVTNYMEAMRMITDGLEARTESAALLNHTSSRAHTIFSLTIKNTALSDDLFDSAGHQKMVTTTTKINMVDLAGSERVKNKTAGGVGLETPSNIGNTSGNGPNSKRVLPSAKSKKQVEEGINVNKSLTVLGKCILALTVRATGSKIHVPFRDSTLTFLLKESLQGNSRTFMVCLTSTQTQHSAFVTNSTHKAIRVCIVFCISSRILVHPRVNTNRHSVHCDLRKWHRVCKPKRSSIVTAATNVSN
jgi:hypothetical protein